MYLKILQVDKSEFNNSAIFLIFNRSGPGECRERGGGEAADVLLSLKHAVVHGDCASETVHPQVYNHLFYSHIKPPTLNRDKYMYRKHVSYFC